MTIWRSLVCAVLLTGAVQAEDAALRWRFRAGDAERYRMTQTAKLELQLVGDNKISTELERIFEFARTVQEVDPNGTATLAIRVSHVQLHVAGPGGQTADYDSAGESESQGFAGTLVPLFQMLMKSEIQAKINSRGELLEFQLPVDFEALLRSKPPGKAVGQVGSVADFESLAKLGLPPLPAQADFAQGGQWQATRTVELEAVGPVVAETTYRWESTDERDANKIAKIVPATIFRFPATEEGKSAVSSTDHMSSGQIHFNLSAGRLESLVSNDALTISTGSGAAAGTLHHTLKVERVTTSD